MELTDRQEEVLDLTRRGLNPEQIANKIGICRNGVYNLQARLRQLEVLQREEIPRAIESKDAIGDIVPRYREQSREFRKWVRDSLPEGCTVADFAVACMIDQFHDEQEAEGPAEAPNEVPPIAERLASVFEWEADIDCERWPFAMTAKDALLLIGCKNPGRASLNAAGRALRELTGTEPRRTNGRKVYDLPSKHKGDLGN